MAEFQVTLGRLALLGVTALLNALLLVSLVEVGMDLKGASAWIAVAGILTLIGGAFAVFGAIKNSAEVTELILGEKDTFCQLTVFNGGPAVGWFVSTLHHGPGGAIYDVQVVIGEIQEDGTPVGDRKRHQLGTFTSNTWPYDLAPLGVDPVRRMTPRYFQAQVTQRNGTSLQDIVIVPQPDGRVELGFLRLEFKGVARAPSPKLLQNGATLVAIPPAETARIFALRERRGVQP